MYIPSAFKVENAEKLTALIEAHSFATVVTHDGQAGFASHLPMLYDAKAGPHGTLISHMARANPQWQHFANGQEVLVIFQGPHAYISPAWYQTQPAVPTWNYAAVHAYGVARLIAEPQRIVATLQAAIAKHEAGRPNAWSAETLPEGYRDGMIKAVVAFEIPVTRLEGKFKLGQNRSAADVAGVCEALAATEDSGGRELGEMMRKEGEGRRIS